MVKIDKIIIKDDLSGEGKMGDSSCPLRNQPKYASHLFVTCYVAKAIWGWIVARNGFHFNCRVISDLRFIDAQIPLKKILIFELIWVVVLWVIWLETVFVSGVPPLIENNYFLWLLFGVRVEVTTHILNFNLSGHVMLRISPLKISIRAWWWIWCTAWVWT